MNKRVIAGVLLFGLLAIAAYSLVVDYNSKLTGRVVEGCDVWEGNSKNGIFPSEDENVDLDDKFALKYHEGTIIFHFFIFHEDAGCEEVGVVRILSNEIDVSSQGSYTKYEMNLKTLFDAARINNPRGRYRIEVLGLQPFTEQSSQFRVNFGDVGLEESLVDINFDGFYDYKLRNGARIDISGYERVLRLDGEDDYISLNTEPDFTKPYSVFMWVKVDDWSKRNRDPNVHESQTLIQQRCNGCESGSKGAMIVGIPSLDDWNGLGISRLSGVEKYRGVSDKIAFMAGRNSSDNDQWVFGSTKIENDVWYPVAVVYDGINAKVYVNGRLEGAERVGSLVSGFNTELVIGGVPEGFNTGWRNFNGNVDNVKIYQRALSDSEVADLSTDIQFNAVWAENNQCDGGYVRIVCTMSKDTSEVYPVENIPGEVTGSNKYTKDDGESVVYFDVDVSEDVRGNFEIGCAAVNHHDEALTSNIGLSCLGDGIKIYSSEPTHNFKGLGWNVNAQSFESGDWERAKLLLDGSGMQFARVLGWSTSWYAPTEDSGRNYYESSSNQGLYKFTEYSNANNISLLLANWNIGGQYLSTMEGLAGDYWNCPSRVDFNQDVTNCWPDQYFWLSEISKEDPNNERDRFCHRNYAGEPGKCSYNEKSSRINVKGVESDHPYDEDVFISTLVDHVKYMVDIKGYHFDFISLWNEPHGDWAYHPRDSSKKYPQSFRSLYEKLNNALSTDPSLSDMGIVGFEGEFIGSEIQFVGDNIDAISLHHYHQFIEDQLVESVESYGQLAIIGEVGDMSENGCGGGWSDLTLEERKLKVLENSFVSVNRTIWDMNHGAYAVARWWYNGDLGCWTATNNFGDDFTDVSKYNYDSYKVLSESLPRVDHDFSVLRIDNPYDINIAAINFAREGEPKKIALWFFNPQNEAKEIHFEIEGIQDGRPLYLSTFDSSGEINYPGYYRLNKINFLSIPPKTIFVLSEYNQRPENNEDFIKGSQNDLSLGEAGSKKVIWWNPFSWFD